MCHPDQSQNDFFLHLYDLQVKMPLKKQIIGVVARFVGERHLKESRNR